MTLRLLLQGEYGRSQERTQVSPYGCRHLQLCQGTSQGHTISNPKPLDEDLSDLPSEAKNLDEQVNYFISSHTKLERDYIGATLWVGCNWSGVNLSSYTKF